MEAFVPEEKVGWDVERFMDRLKDKPVDLRDPKVIAMDPDLQKFFPAPEMQAFTEPAVFVDVHERILMWYLPGLLLPARIVS